MTYAPMKNHLFMALLSSAVFMSAAAPAYAQTADGKRGEVFCFPAKGVPKLINRVNGVDAKRRDVVNVTIDPKFLIKDGGVWPDDFYLAKDGEIVTEMPFSREDGRIPNFVEAVKAAPNTDICVVDPTRADKPEDDEGLYFEMGLSPYFLTANGEHDMATLNEGCRDAKVFYKKMIPAAVRMFMPDTDYLGVKYKDLANGPEHVLPGANPGIFARVGDNDVPLEYEAHKDLYVVSAEDMKKLGASALIVRGGAYDILPVPSPSTMRRFNMGGGKTEEQLVESTSDNTIYGLGDK